MLSYDLSVMAQIIRRYGNFRLRLFIRSLRNTRFIAIEFIGPLIVSPGEKGS